MEVNNKIGDDARKDQHGITKDEKAQEQPTDTEAAQKAGVKEQRDAAKQPESPGEPASGE